MEPRRLARAVVDPKVRQVGFFTPQTSQDTSQMGLPESTSPALSGMSLPPVMIPPPRNSADPSLHRSVTPDDVPVGSFNPLESIDSCGESSNWVQGINPNSGLEPKEAKSSNPPEKNHEKVSVQASQGQGEPQSLNTKTLKERTTKAERRALQDAQRAAKSSAKTGSKGGGHEAGGNKESMPMKQEGPQERRSTAADRKKEVLPPRMQFDGESRVEKTRKQTVVRPPELKNHLELFRNLPQYDRASHLPVLHSRFFSLSSMHPSVHEVGLQFLTGDVTDDDARCVAMLRAFRSAVADYTLPSGKALARDLASRVGSFVSFLIECRPLSVGMGNAVRFLKTRIARLPPDVPESEAKASVCSDIDRFIAEKIALAGRVIAGHAATKIRDGDVLLTYGASSAVELVLLHARCLGRRFRAVIVDSRPGLEARRLLRRLVLAGVPCTYTQLNGVSYVMREATRVLLGASSVLSNGTAYSAVGTASVAMVAAAFRVPVLVCCEAYKFHERVQLDSICFNELGDPDAVAPADSKLQVLNLTYDVTPSSYISVIVTDYGMIPPTSVPVIVREFRREQLWEC